MVHKPCRVGQTHPALLAFAGSAVLLAGLIGLLSWNPERSSPAAANEPLLVFCAAGLKVPVEAVAREYEKTYGVAVQLQFEGSQSLLAKVEIGRRGDLFIPADDSYLDMARKKD